jgi:hypothetical protein
VPVAVVAELLASWATLAATGFGYPGLEGTIDIFSDRVAVFDLLDGKVFSPGLDLGLSPQPATRSATIIYRNR